MWITEKYQKEYCSNGTPNDFLSFQHTLFMWCLIFCILISKMVSCTSFSDDCVSSIGRLSLKRPRSWLWLLVFLWFIGFSKKVSSSCPLVGRSIDSCKYKNELLYLYQLWMVCCYSLSKWRWIFFKVLVPTQWNRTIIHLYYFIWGVWV